MDIDDEEFVETSDIEELAELQHVRRFAVKSPRRATNHEEGEDLPRKRIKFEHPPTQMFMRLSVSPQKTSSSRARSRSSSLTLEQSSPSPLFTVSRSPTVESQEVILPKAITNDAHDEILVDEDSISQDPLLLCTPPRRIEVLDITISTTPVGSPTGPWVLSPAVDVLKLLPSISLANAEHNEVNDAAMLFTPVNSPARLPSPSLSPIFPESSPYKSVHSPGNILPATSSPSRMAAVVPSRESSRSPTPAPSIPAPQVPVQAPVNRDHALALALEQDNAQKGRYPLRDRRPAQLRPFSAEEIIYIRSMRSNPEAIVKKLALRRHGHDSGRYEEEETQRDVYHEDGNVPEEEDEEWQRQERRRLRREEKRRDAGEVEMRQLGSQQQQIMDALPTLPEDSDEEGQDKLAKEAARYNRKKLEGERKRRREEKEEKDRKRRLKRFPAIPKDPTVVSVSSPTSTRRSKTREPEVEGRSESPGPIHSDMDDLFSDVYIPPPIHIPSSPNRFHDTNQASSSTSNAALHDAHHDMDWDADGLEFNTHLMDTADDVPENSRRQQDRDSDQEQLADANGDQPLEETIDLPKSKLKYLRKIWPISMIKQAAKGESSAAKRKKEQKRRERMAQDDGGELAPGQSRIKKLAKPRDVNEIKGDTESEVEIGSDHPNSPPSPPYRQNQHVISIPTDSESEDEVEVLESYRRPFVSRRRPEPEIRRDDSPSAEDTFDEDDLEDYILAPETNGIDHLRDPSLIDYMLTRERPRGATTRLSRTRRRRTSASPAHQSSVGRGPAAASAAAPRHRYSSSTPGPSMSSQSSSVVVRQDVAEPSSSSSKYRLDVTTTGGRRLGHAKQTLLDYHIATKPKSKPKANHSTKASSSSRPSQAAPRRSHTTKKASRPNVSYLFRDDEDDAPSDSFPAPAPQYAAKHKKQPSSRSRVTAEHEARPSRPRLSKSTSSADRAAATSKYTADADNYESHPNRERDREAEARRLERARKKRLRKQRAKKIGVWCNQERGQVVTSGVAQTFVTVDIEDEDFHVSLVPTTASKEQTEHWSTHFRPSPSPPARLRRRRQPMSDAGSEADIDDPPPHPQHATTRAEEPLRNLPNDMNVPFLQPGKSFEAEAYISKGKLHELVNVISGSGEPVRPAPLSILDISLDPSMGVDQFCAIFSDITEEAFSFSTELPSVMEDEEQGTNGQDKDDLSQKQWLLITQAACRMISWYVHNAQQIEVDHLRESVEKAILQLAAKIEDFQFKSTSSSVLVVTWFMVEALARAGQAPQNQYSLAKMPKSLKTAVTLLMRLLLNVEMEETVMKLAENVDLGVKTTPGFAAELWVRLIHLFHDPTPAGLTAQSKHPFWSLFIEALKMRSSRLPIDSQKSRPFNASEDVWVNIFMICALSQFSLHGVIAGQPRLPACWDAVVYALKIIRLQAQDDPKLDNDDLKRHDEYVALLVNRCMALRQKWHWSLRDSSNMFNAVADIFRSRQFANLLHETKIRLPDFMRLQKMNLVSSYNPEDTAYTVFLKLVVQAAQEDSAHTREKPSPRVKKFLSLAVPVGALPEYDETSKAGRQKCRSMFYNRLAAIAVAVDLDIQSYDERITKAQDYVPSIGTSHSKLQFDVIGGLTSWAQFFVYRSIKLDGLTRWFKLIAADLSKRKQSQGSGMEAMKETRTNLALSAALLSSVRRIYASHVDLGIYPEPLLIQGLQPILNTWLVKHEDMSDHVKCFLEKLFEARFALLGKPTQIGANVAELGEDSQDYWGTDADIPSEALVDPIEPFKDQETSLYTHLNKSYIRHAISQHLGRSLRPPPPDVHQKLYEKEYDSWIRLALSYYTVDFELQRWKDGIQTVYSVIKISAPEGDNENWTQRIHLSAMYHILLLHPMSYGVMIDEAVKILMLALVSAGEALENAYVAHFLSVGGLQHPLLQNATFLPPVTTSGTYEFSPAEFADIRLSFFKLVLHNLDIMDVVNRQKYSGMCANAFSSMKESLKTHRKRNGYEQFCRDIKIALDGTAQLVDDPKFDYWTKLWTP